MDRRTVIRALAIWILLAFLAILNGAFRELFLKPNLGESEAHFASIFLLVFIIIIVAHLFVRSLKNCKIADLFLIGVLWTSLTIFFEFGFGLLMGKDLNILLAEYNFFEGRIWVLVPATTLISPLLV
mgnify:CR=1 FL=1